MPEVGKHEFKAHKMKKHVKVLPKVYVADKIIGNGSFGVVYKAMQGEQEDENESKYVAIKKVY